MRVRIAILIGLLAVSAAAQRVSRFDSSIVVDRDGSALVIETIELASPVQHLDRTIPVCLGREVANHELVVDVVRAESLAGQRIPWKKRRAGDSVVIRVASPPRDGVKLTYWVRNATAFETRNDVIAWGATDRNYLIDAATVTVALPTEAAGRARGRAQLYAEDIVEDSPVLWAAGGVIPVENEGASLVTHSPGPLARGVALHVTAAVEKGILHPPSALRRANWFLSQNRIVLLPIFTLLLITLLRWQKSRVGPEDTSIATRYEPPEGMTPAEAGALIDDSVDARDVGATLIDLIGRKYIRADACEEQVEGEKNVRLTLEQPLEECVGLAAHERTMLFHSFYGGQWTELHSLRLRFPVIVPYFERDVMRALRLRGYYGAAPKNALALRELVLAAVGVLLIAAHMLGLMPLFQSPMLAVYSIAISGAIVWLLSPKLNTKTGDGGSACAEVRGFAHFLETVDADRMRRLTPELRDKYLPFAVAFGVEHHWREVFESVAEVPDNYVEQAEIAATREFMERGEPVGALFAVAQNVIWGNAATLPTRTRARGAGA